MKSIILSLYPNLAKLKPIEQEGPVYCLVILLGAIPIGIAMFLLSFWAKVPGWIGLLVVAASLLSMMLFRIAKDGKTYQQTRLNVIKVEETPFDWSTMKEVEGDKATDLIPATPVQI